MICTGRGDTDGGHCCYINGEVCQFLFTDRGGTPRCKLFSEWGKLDLNNEWVNSPIGSWFASRYPGYECGDWPQNIPAVMESQAGKCCWNDAVEVTLGNVG